MQSTDGKPSSTIVVIVGRRKSGKSAFCRSVADGRYAAGYSPTLATDLLFVHQANRPTVRLFDTAGGDRPDSLNLITGLLRLACLVLLSYDTAAIDGGIESLLMDGWIARLRERTVGTIVVLRCKIDLLTAERRLSIDDECRLVRAKYGLIIIDAESVDPPAATAVFGRMLGLALADPMPPTPMLKPEPVPVVRSVEPMQILPTNDDLAVLRTPVRRRRPIPPVVTHVIRPDSAPVVETFAACCTIL